MPQWGDDDLTRFLDVVSSNQRVNFSRFPDSYRLMARVNDCLSLVGKNFINPPQLMPVVFCLRSQYAYKTAAGLALAGQVVETFVVLRSCLEYAGYAAAIFNDPALEAIFLRRHLSVDDMKIQKDKFRIGEIKKVIEEFDPKLAELFQTFYERTIDFGGHPNPHAINSVIQLDQERNSQTIATQALSTEEPVLLHAMKNVAQVGLTSLYIFQHIFAAKFALLGIRDEMERLRMENL